MQIRTPPEKPVWLVCRTCTFAMHCYDILDAHEIAKRHLDAYGCKGVDFFYQLSEYREAMSAKSLRDPGKPVYQNQRKHRQPKVLNDYDHQLL